MKTATRQTDSSMDTMPDLIYRKPTFKDLSQSKQYEAMRLCWPVDWHSETKLTVEQHRQLDVDLQAYANRYFNGKMAIPVANLRFMKQRRVQTVLGVMVPIWSTN